MRSTLKTHSWKQAETEVFGRIAEVDPNLWDSLTDPDDLQSTHRFVRACEESRVEAATYRHILVHSEGALAAVASLCRMTVSLDLLAHPTLRALLSVPRHVHPDFLRVPVIFCGLPVSFGRPCLRIRPGADRETVLGAVDREMEAFARDEGAPVLCFKEFSDAEARDVGFLESSGYVRAASLPACSLRLRWGNFQGYLDSLRAPYRRQILVDRQRTRGLGLHVRLVEDFSGDCPRIFALYEQVIERARFRLERLNLAFFERLNDLPRLQSRALLLETGEHVLAAAILLYAPRTVTFLLAGIDYETNREHRAYPNLVTAVVEEAIRAGAQILELGQTSYALKTRLGGVPDPRWLYLRSPRRLPHLALRSASPALFPVTRTPERRVFRG